MIPTETDRSRITQRGKDRKIRIKEVATDMFLSYGYEGTSVDEIMKQVGGSKTNLYNYFGGKEGLFNAVVQALCEDVLASLKILEVDNLDLRSALLSIGHRLLAMILDERHVAFQRLVIAESGRFPTMARIWFESGPEASRKIITRCIQIHQANGSLRRSDPFLIATLFHDMIVTNPLYLALIGSGLKQPELKRVLEEATDVILEYMTVRN